MTKYIYSIVGNRGFFIPEEIYEDIKNNDLTQYADVIIDNNYGTVLKNKHGKNFRDNWKKQSDPKLLDSIDKVEYANE